MSKIKKLVITVISLALVVFTVVFVMSACGSKKGGTDEAEVTTTKTFVQKLEGTWVGSGDISAITFMKDGKTTLNLLGVVLDGEYTDNFDIETETHTIKLKYKTIAGVSVERYYVAELVDDNKLTLKDNKLDFLTLEFNRSDGTDIKSLTTSTSANSGNGATETSSQQTTLNVALIQDSENLKKAIVGEWKDSTGTNSGYEFKKDGTVTIKLLGLSYEGNYTVEPDAASGKCVLRITYANIGGSKITNGYYVSVDGSSLSLVQKGAEAITLRYTKA